MPLSLEPYLEFAKQVAWEAGRMTLGYFQTGIDTEYKTDDSPVTIADRQTEQFIRRQIETRFPEHAIVGEEFGVSESADATFRWIIDPIDGTKSFMRGVPLYGVLLGLEIEGRVEVGVVVLPALNDMLYAASGLGCWWNGRRAQVSTQTELSRSIVAHIDTSYFGKHGKGAAWERLQQAVYYNAGWCDAYAYFLAATGRVEIAIDPIMSLWDCGPYPVIFREAGGYFGDWSGNETLYTTSTLATSKHLLPQILPLLNE